MLASAVGSTRTIYDLFGKCCIVETCLFSLDIDAVDVVMVVATVAVVVVVAAVAAVFC